MQKLTRVCTFPSELAAQQAKNFLAAEGISGYLENANTQTMLGYVGPALGGVKLLVPDEDVDSAKQLLAKEDVASTIAAWTCPRCGSEVDSGFELCWKCGHAFNDSETPAAPADSGLDAVDTRNASYAAHENERPAFPAANSENPFLPASSGENASRPTDVPASQDVWLEEQQGLIRNAFTLSILGLVILPGIMHAYSMYLLIKAGVGLNLLPPMIRRRYYAAMAINVVCLAACFYFLVTVFFSPV